MRRLVGGIATAALAAALFLGVAVASPLTPADESALDLRPQLMLRLFGESTDARASLAAAYGDRSSESPLRDLALSAQASGHAAFAGETVLGPTFALGRTARTAIAPGEGAFDLAQTIGGQAFLANLHFSAPTQTGQPSAVSPADAGRALQAQTFTAGQYQPVASVPLVSAQSVAFSFAPLAHGASSPLAASTALAFGASSVPAGAAGTSSQVPLPVHLGPLQFTTQVESASLAAPALSMNDNAYGAGANFNVRAGARNLNVDLSSNYERLTRNDATGSTFGAMSSWQLPDAAAPLLIPNYADLNKVTVGAALAVPVVNGLTLNLNYAADRMFGGYGLPGLTNLDATDNSYGGQLTFQIPHSSSTLSISARQLRYQDNLIPANTSTQTREDVNFTVKF